jgi:hypothetical protein
MVYDVVAEPTICHPAPLPVGWFVNVKVNIDVRQLDGWHAEEQ